MRGANRVLGVNCDVNRSETWGTHNVELISASSAEAALKRLAAEDFHAIYVDHQRIELDEIEFLQRIRDLDPEIPVHTFTGEGTELIGTEVDPQGGCTQSEGTPAPYTQYSTDELEAWIETKDAVPNFVELLESLFEHMPIHLFIKDRMGRHVWTSSSFYDDTDKWIGKRDFEVDNDASDEFAMKAYEDDIHVLESGESLVDIEEYDSSLEKYFRTTKIPWVDKNGDVGALLGYSIDITEQKEREQKLRDRQEMLTHIGDNLGAVIWVSAPDEDVAEFIGEAYEEIWGRSTQSLREEPQSFIDAIHEEDRPRVMEALEEQEENPESYDEIYRVVRPDGSVRWVRDRAFGVRNDEGELKRTVGIANDITDLKEKEEELTLQRDRFSALFEKFPEPTIAIKFHDGEPVLQNANPEFESVFGYDTDEIVGRPINEIIVPPEKIRDARRLDLRVRRNELIDEEIIRLTEEGPRHFLFRNIPIPGETDPDTYGVYVDITEIKEAEGELRESIRLHRVVDRFLQHNFHNDMNIIQGYAETIRDNVEEPESKYADRIVNTGNKLLSTVEKEREITRLLAETQPLFSKELTPLVQNAVTTARERHPNAHIKVDELCSERVVATDSITDALLELITNAIIHSEQETPEVTVTTSSREDTVALQVVDTGPQIPKIELDVLSGHSDITSLSHGSGLGLWFVYLTMQASTGELSFVDNDPRGNIVTMELSKIENPRK